MNGKKISLKEAKQEFINRGYIPLFEEYKSNNIKLDAKTKEGYKISINLSNLKSGFEPRILDRFNKYSIENIKLGLILNNFNLTLISNEYKATQDYLIFKTEEGYIGIQKSSNLFSLKIMPNIFSKTNPYTIENIKLWLIINKLPYKLLSSEFISAGKDNLLWNCPIDGNFEMRWANMQTYKSCRMCGIRNKSGEGSYNWKGGISPLHEYLRHKISKWKIDSFKKYKYRCDITDETSHSLIIHHYYNFSDILQETMNALNLPIYNKVNKYTKYELNLIEKLCLELHYKYGLGVCLCKEEHELFHSIYTKQNNTKEQYIEFKEMRLNQIHNQAS